MPKNTKVRSTFREVLHNVHGFVLPDVLKDVGSRDGDDGNVLQHTTGNRGKTGGAVFRPPDSQISHALQPAGQLAVKDAVLQKPSQLPQPRTTEDNSENVVPEHLMS